MKAKVSVDVGDQGPSIDPKVFGHFLENMGRSLYRGGLLAPDGSVRPDVGRALSDLRVSVLRWPGGLFADGYHWRDGVGPDRPVRPNAYWRRLGPLLGPRDPNHFGTHEFLGLCGDLSAEPYINVNLGSGTCEEAAAWVEYCNGPADSAEGARRAEHGHPDPWGVGIWGIGNETFGFWATGYTDSATYARRYLAFDEAMRAQDPSIEPVAVGTCDLWPDWNPTLLDAIGDRAAFLSVHVYLPGNKPPYLFLAVPGGAANHYALCAAYLELDRKLRFVANQIREVLGPQAATRIALDEWNLWWWWPQAYRVWWRMRDAVAVAGMAGAMVDNCETVTMGNLAQAVNVLGLLRTRQGAVVKTPPYFVMQMFAETIVGRRVASTVESQTYASKKIGGIPKQDAVPFVSAHGAVDQNRLGLMLIQRRFEGPMRVTVEAPGVTFESAKILSAPDPDARNTFSRPTMVGVREIEITDGKGGAVLELPPASVAALTGRAGE